MKTHILTKMNGPNKITSRKGQRGMGMVEVLVAMVLLAIGVLGYAALQIRAVEASGEALNRSQAMVILRGLAEEIRVNSAAQGSYPAAVQAQFTTLAAPGTLCTADCTSAQLATFDAYQTALTASNLGMKVTMVQCPGVSSAPVKRQCLLAAWGKTTLSAGGTLPTTLSSPPTNCMLSDGVYQPNATCVMMEAY